MTYPVHPVGGTVGVGREGRRKGSGGRQCDVPCTSCWRYSGGRERGKEMGIGRETV